VVTGEAALTFPTDYPVKILGRPADDLRAHSREHIEALVTDLKACDGVMMLL
jgi:putative lipoic acid-binding regulatory protein